MSYIIKVTGSATYDSNTGVATLPNVGDAITIKSSFPLRSISTFKLPFTIRVKLWLWYVLRVVKSVFNYFKNAEGKK